MMRKIGVAGSLLAWGAVLCGGTVPVTSIDQWHDLLNNAAYVVLDVYLPGCSECDLMAPRYEAVSGETEFSSWVFAKINFREQGDLAREIVEMTSLPTVAVVHNGTIVDVTRGDALTEEQLRELLRKQS